MKKYLLILLLTVHQFNQSSALDFLHGVENDLGVETTTSTYETTTLIDSTLFDVNPLVFAINARVGDDIAAARASSKRKHDEDDGPPKKKKKPKNDDYYDDDDNEGHRKKKPSRNDDDEEDHRKKPHKKGDDDEDNHKKKPHKKDDDDEEDHRKKPHKKDDDDNHTKKPHKKDDDDDQKKKPHKKDDDDDDRKKKPKPGTKKPKKRKHLSDEYDEVLLLRKQLKKLQLEKKNRDHSGIDYDGDGVIDNLKLTSMNLETFAENGFFEARLGIGVFIVLLLVKVYMVLFRQK